MATVKGKILITGGCGYIGSHAATLFSEAGHDVTVLDNLSTGFREALIKNEKLEIADLRDLAALEPIFAKNKFDTVIHFAASISVPESVADPLKYFRNNIGSTLNLLAMCEKYKVKRFIFSSTAATYGNQDGSGLVTEEADPNPSNAYGLSKLMAEEILQTSAPTFGLQYVILRYFNVAGAHPGGLQGQRTENATHLLKVACEAALGVRNEVKVFGSDYATKDGTGVRDYIHVWDLVEAHICAYDYLAKGGKSTLVNCGYGQGYTVLEVLDSVKRLTGAKIKVTMTGRREGDVAQLVADNSKIKAILGWKPKLNHLDTIVKSAYTWEKKRLKG